MNSWLEYCIDFQILEKVMNHLVAIKVSISVCASPLLQFIDAFPEKINLLNFQFYFDNLFTSLNLLIELNKRNYEGTGTVREGRMKTGV